MAKQKEIALDNAQGTKTYPITDKIKSIGYWGKIDNMVFTVKKETIGSMFDPKNGSQRMGKTSDAECWQGEFGKEPTKNDGEFFINLTIFEDKKHESQEHQLRRAGVIK